MDRILRCRSRAAALLLTLAPGWGVAVEAQAPGPAADDGRGQPIRAAIVHDGDTLRLPSGLVLTVRPAPVRIVGIDAPELAQPGPWGMAALDRLTELIAAPDAAVHPLGIDAYGRVLARVTAGREDVAVVLVREGLAYAWTPPGRRPPPGWDAIRAAEAEARAAKRGVWSDPTAERPEQWRRRRRAGAR